ncbi:hypothetical protein [Thiohalobacter sp.]|uniref:hypothetical protein n=1 Tax=Thiohalobacter sp. TaxID=2025948 RepID=UPI0026378AE2|nr:hypothetical protein [Thiohalobacter sp.]
MRQGLSSAPATTGTRWWPGLLLWLLLALHSRAWGMDEWVLRGTVVLGEAQGYAIVERPDGGGQVMRKVGEWLVPGMRLETVAADHALVSEQGVSRRLSFGARLSGPQPGRTDGGSAFRLDPLRLPEIVAAIDVIPHQQNGRVDGYYANAIPEPLRKEIGLQPGDLVRRVNGIPLDDRVDAGQLYRQLEAGQLAVEIERHGRPIRLIYRLGS